MNFADDSFYNTEYLCGRKAVIPTASFDFYARSATMEIRHYIGDNLDGVANQSDLPAEVRMCCCEVAEIILKAEKSDLGKTAEHIGSWSASYESGEQAQDSVARQIKSAVYKWLNNSGLLFRGVRWV